MGVTDNGDWNTWSKHVLFELKRLSGGQEIHSKLLCEIKAQIATLKVKSGVWGMIGGAIPITIGLAIWLIKNNK